MPPVIRPGQHAERRRGMRELELDLAETRVELVWTRRIVTALLIIQGGHVAAQIGPWFS